MPPAGGSEGATCIKQIGRVVVKYFVKEPAIDVVIVNWNYARFVADAIKSVKDQSYRNFRCIVVDNGSDDDSVDRIAETIDNHPQFSFLRSPTNLGHLGGALWSLEHANGEFVTFLDADDVLFPTYLASHLQAHLAAGSSTGFTSSNCVDMNAEGALLTSGNCNMYNFWHQGVPALRPIERTVRLAAVDDNSYSALAQAARYLAAHTPHWCWCPGSSNMFRRALLDRIRPTDPSPAMFGGVDGFFLPILHALTGTLLIDQPLSAYRLHGSNDFSTLPSLTGILSAHPKVKAQSFGSYLRMLTWLVDHLDEVVLMTGANRYWQVLRTAAATHPLAREAFSQPEFKAALARRYPRLVELFGELHVFRELRGRVLFLEYLDIVLAAPRRAFPAAPLCRALCREVVRKSWLLYKKIA
jgi:glycosyltransferase involved in cell wall biosynthesis